MKNKLVVSKSSAKMIDGNTFPQLSCVSDGNVFPSEKKEAKTDKKRGRPRKKELQTKPADVAVPVLFTGVGDELLTCKDICSILKIGRTTLWKWHSAGRLPTGRRVGLGRGVIRYLRSEIEAWMQSTGAVAADVRGAK
jgi:predicted DNA-binding transcriptional regulator AlpA